MNFSRFSRKRQNGSAPIFFKVLKKTLVHCNLHWKTMHPAFKLQLH